jgi:hypothetical protein
MTTFPNSPRLQKGALVGLDPFNPIYFQYNPETLSRTLTPRTEGGDKSNEAMRIVGPPEETINVDLVIDATDQLEKGKKPAVTMGIYPALSSLEMLLYPKSLSIIANEVLSAIGIMEVIPPEAPLTLFVWGEKRVLPVRITQFSITEEAFDPDLNPIQAKVKLAMKVLSYHELGLKSTGGAIFMAHQALKEVAAVIGNTGGSINV